MFPPIFSPLTMPLTWNWSAAGRRTSTLSGLTSTVCVYAKSIIAFIASAVTPGIMTRLRSVQNDSLVNRALKYVLHALRMARWIGNAWRSATTTASVSWPDLRKSLRMLKELILYFVSRCVSEPLSCHSIVNFRFLDLEQTYNTRLMDETAVSKSIASQLTPT